MRQLYGQRGFVVFVEVIYLLVLFALAVIDLTDLRRALHFTLPELFRFHLHLATLQAA